MIDISLFLETLGVILQPVNFLLIFVGMVVGLFFGALPGISSSMGIVLMLPLYLFNGHYPLHYYVGRLVCRFLPTAARLPRFFLTRPVRRKRLRRPLTGIRWPNKEKAGRALGLAVTASSVGGIVSVLIMLVSAPLLSSVALKIQSAEYFALTLLGLTCIAGIGGSGTPMKALISGCVGSTPGDGRHGPDDRISALYV